MKEKPKTYYSIWNRLIDGFYTRKDIDGFLDGKEPLSSKEFDEVSDRLWKEGEELSSSMEEWIANEQLALQIINKSEKKRILRHTTLYKQWGGIAATILFFVLLGGTYFYISHEVPVEQNEIYVSYGEKQEVILPDGTKVILNSGSYIKYPKQFGNKDRQIIFKGEAYFDVAKNEECPFIIQSQDYKVRVLGTTFNLNNYEESEELHLTLITGKVMMNFGDEQLKLSPGERLVMNKINMKLEREQVNTQNYMLWMENKLYFDRTPIHEVIKQLERIYNCNIQLDQHLKSDNLLSGTHDNNNLEAVLKSIHLATGIKYKKENNLYLLYK